MEITRENIKKAIKLLKKIPYNPTDKNKSFLFLPIEPKKIENDAFVLDVKTSKGAASCLKAGLIIDKDENETVIRLGYAQTEYATKLDLDDYLDLQDHKYNKKDLEEVCTYDCFILRQEYLVGLFECN